MRQEVHERVGLSGRRLSGSGRRWRSCVSVGGRIGRRAPHLTRPGRVRAPPTNPVWDSRDRRDLALLGLWVLVYGLAVAPVLHAVVGHGGGLGGHTHVHGPGGHVHRAGGTACGPAGTAEACQAEAERSTPGRADSEHDDAGEKQGHGHRHLTGSVEHLLAVAASWAVFVPPVLRWVSWRVEPARGPEWSPGQRLRSSAMPQGP